MIRKIILDDIISDSFVDEKLGWYSGVSSDASILIALKDDHGAGFFGFKNIEEFSNLIIDILPNLNVDDHSQKELGEFLISFNQDKDDFLKLLNNSKIIDFKDIVSFLNGRIRYDVEWIGYLDELCAGDNKFCVFARELFHNSNKEIPTEKLPAFTEFLTGDGERIIFNYE